MFEMTHLGPETGDRATLIAIFVRHPFVDEKNGPRRHGIFSRIIGFARDRQGA
jgi:hypothetical protein